MVVIFVNKIIQTDQLFYMEFQYL